MDDDDEDDWDDMDADRFLFCRLSSAGETDLTGLRDRLDRRSTDLSLEGMVRTVQNPCEGIEVASSVAILSKSWAEGRSYLYETLVARPCAVAKKDPHCY